MSKLIDAAKSNKVKTSIDFVMRRNPLYWILKELCQKDLFGPPERAFLENYAHDDSLPPEHWFWDYGKSGGIWVEHGVHFFDLAHWLLGSTTRLWGGKLPRLGKDLVDRVIGVAYYESDTLVSYYHGFTKPEAFEDTSFSLIFERAYTKARGWIPVELTVDAMVNPDIEKYMREDLLNLARAHLPGIQVDMEAKVLEKWHKPKALRGRGKSYEASSRMCFTYRLGEDRWQVYRACVRRGIEDLAQSIVGEKENPDVDLLDAKLALEVAYGM